jgi:hypothetical protein
MKYDNGKTDLSLIPVEALVEVADVLGFGAKKYGRDNHRLDGHKTEWSRTYASIQRHLNDFWAGEDIDPESGQKHLTHAITQCIILLTQINDGHANMDDRFATRIKNETKVPTTTQFSGSTPKQFLGTQLTPEAAELIKLNKSNPIFSPFSVMEHYYNERN